MKFGVQTGLLMVLLVCGLAADSPAGEFEETERRLKSAGIEPALRTRIHAGIDRAVAFLQSKQNRAGAWPCILSVPFAAQKSGAVPAVKSRTGAQYTLPCSEWTTALAALALQHSGAPRAEIHARAALAWLVGKRRAVTASSVYAAGFTALLCHGLSEKKQGTLLAKGLASGFGRRSGLWGYSVGRGPVPGVRGKNLVSSHVAARGLWAGERLGLPTAKAVWRRHLAWLLDNQHPDGSWWGSVPKRQRNWSNSRPQGAFMGLASLLIARAALRTEIALDPALRERVLAAESRARTAMRRFGRWYLRGHVGLLEGRTPLWFLHALETAAIFANVEFLGRTRWYREGAMRLLDLQNADGSWNTSQWLADPRQADSRWDGTRVQGTAFGLLFLLRISEAQRPVTISAPVTGKPTLAPEARREPEPKVGPAALGALVGRAVRQVRDPRRSNDDLVRVLENLSSASLRADGAAPSMRTWTRAAERVLISALRLVDVDAGTKENRRARVNVRAATLLRKASPEVLGPVREFLQDEARNERRFTVGVDLLQACFDVVAHHGDAETLRWVVDEAVWIEKSTRAWIFTGAALASVEGFHHLPVDVRRVEAGRLARRYIRLEEAAGRVRHRTGAHLGHFWNQTRPDVLIAVFDLARRTTKDPDLRVAPDISMRELASVASAQR